MAKKTVMDWFSSGNANKTSNNNSSNDKNSKKSLRKDKGLFILDSDFVDNSKSVVMIMKFLRIIWKH